MMCNQWRRYDRDLLEPALNEVTRCGPGNHFPHAAGSETRLPAGSVRTAHVVYDVEVETSISAPGECASGIQAALEETEPATAFRQLEAMVASGQKEGSGCHS